MPEVTVIMPALNVAKYIRPCMDSVCGQTFRDLEILFIDAGSTDGTLEIVEEYAKKDGRIRIIHSEKKSYGYQLNVGIREATGNYVGVVETDDIIVSDMFETLHREARKGKADYVKGKAERFWEDPVYGYIKEPIDIFQQKYYDEHDGVIELKPNQITELVYRDYYIWDGIYKRCFIEEIVLNETPGAAYQDIGFMIQAHSCAQKAIYVDKLVYKYRRDNLGASCYSRNAFHFLVQEYNYVEDFIKDKEKNWKAVCNRKLYLQTCSRMRAMAQSGEFWEEALPDILQIATRLKKAIDNDCFDENLLADHDRDYLMYMLEDPKILYGALKEIHRQQWRPLQSFLEQIDSPQPIVIFGSGNWGKFLHALLERKLPGRTVAFCDNNNDMQGTELQGLTVLSPEQAAERFPEAIYVITGRRYESEMREQLSQLQIPEENRVTYKLGINLQFLQI